MEIITETTRALVNKRHVYVSSWYGNFFWNRSIYKLFNFKDMSNVNHGHIKVDHTKTAFCQWAGCTGNKRKHSKERMIYDEHEDMYFCVERCNSEYVSYNWTLIVKQKALTL